MAVQKSEVRPQLRVIENPVILAELGNYQLIRKKVFGWNYQVLNTKTGDSELFTSTKEACTYLAWKHARRTK